MMTKQPIRHQGFSEAGLENIDTLMQSYISAGKSAGIVTLLSRNGRIVRLSCHGNADIASATPIRNDTIFRIYSMTKPITSVALMSLIEQGRCKLDDAAKRWLPALAKLEVYQRGRIQTDITIRQLLTHTAGFSYGFAPEKHPVDRLYAEIWRQPIRQQTIEQLLQSLLQIPLIAKPGTRWHYSIATDICGYLVEQMSDMPLAEYLQKTIFEPLQMQDTAFEVPASKVHRFATLYGHTDMNPLAQLETREDSPFIASAGGTPIRLHSGGGGLTSTAMDYWRFSQMMLNGGELAGQRIVEPATVALMTSNHIPATLLPLSFNGVAPGEFDGYGFGLGYCINLDPRTTAAAGSAGDFGWGGMADTYCWVDPKHQLVAILLQQFMPSLHHAGRKEFRDAVYRALA